MGKKKRGTMRCQKKIAWLVSKGAPRENKWT